MQVYTKSTYPSWWDKFRAINVGDDCVMLEGMTGEPTANHRKCRLATRYRGNSCYTNTCIFLLSLGLPHPRPVWGFVDGCQVDLWLLLLLLHRSSSCCCCGLLLLLLAALADDDVYRWRRGNASVSHKIWYSGLFSQWPTQSWFGNYCTRQLQESSSSSHHHHHHVSQELGCPRSWEGETDPDSGLTEDVLHEGDELPWWWEGVYLDLKHTQWICEPRRWKGFYLSCKQQILDNNVSLPMSPVVHLFDTLKKRNFSKTLFSSYWGNKLFCFMLIFHQTQTYFLFFCQQPDRRYEKTFSAVKHRYQFWFLHSALLSYINKHRHPVLDLFFLDFGRFECQINEINTIKPFKQLPFATITLVDQLLTI